MIARVETIDPDREARFHEAVRKAMRDEVDELSAEVGGQKIKLRGEHVSLFILFIIALFVGILSWIMWQHQQDGRMAGLEFVQAIKEQTMVIREQARGTREANCLSQFEIRDRASKADFCRQISL